ncbi:MAG: RsmG family class I SAM-dependent methyltransferase [Planctomycetota bacterium]
MIDPEFADALNRHSIEIPEEIAARVQRYVEAMWKINESLNLTRHTTWDLFVGRDLRDCVHLANLLQPGEEVLDWGSGNGVPGLVLAMLRGDVDVALAESVGKRAAALGEIIAGMDLPVAVYAARGEDLLDDFRFSSVVARAVGSITKFCRWIGPQWSSVDRLLLIKGPRWVEERGEARHLGLLKDLTLRRAAAYPLGDEGENEGVILEIRPRREGDASL